MLLQEFTSGYDEIMLTLIGENYGAALIDMSFPQKVQDLYETIRKQKDSYSRMSMKSSNKCFLLRQEQKSMNV